MLEKELEGAKSEITRLTKLHTQPNSEGSPSNSNTGGEGDGSSNGGDEGNGEWITRGWKSRARVLEKEVKELAHWKIRAKNYEKDLKEAQKWKAVVTKREKQIEKRYS